MSNSIDERFLFCFCCQMKVNIRRR